ncbi:MAG: TlpA family protein disulfide reductase [Propioniciclava sp.]
MSVRLLAALLTLVGLLTGCGSAPTSAGGFVGGDGTLTIIAPADRQPAPEVTGELLDGTPFDSADLSGVIVYNVWGSWCAPCRSEAPALVEAAEETSGTAVFVGLNTRDPDPAQAEAFVRAFGVPYANVYDPDGALLLRFGTQLPPSAIPSTLVIDADGRVAARILGETTRATLVGVIDDVAAGR